MARLMFINVLRWLAMLLAVIGLWIALMEALALLVFVPGFGDLLYDTANAVGIAGDEGVEDFYFNVSAIFAVIASLATVYFAHRLWKRRVARRIDFAAK